nr:MFS transporter [Caldivirga maquilingensis]
MASQPGYTREDIERGIKRIYQVVLAQSHVTPYFIIGIAIASLFLDAYDFSAFSLATAAFKNTWPWMSSALFGFAIASIQIGATIGALTGGWLNDRIGRRNMLILNMILFVAMAIGAGLAPDPYTFSIFRILLGYALGADIVTGFSYIFEFLEFNKRLVFSGGFDAYWFGSVVFAIVFIVFPLYFALHSLTHPIIWRAIMVIGGIAAFIILLFRSRIPESVLWIAYRGRLATAKRIIKQVYGIDLQDVPDVDLDIHKVRGFRSLFRIFRRSKWKELTSTFIGTFEGGIEFYSFGFYTPYILLVLSKIGSLATLVSTTIINVAGFAAGIATAYLVPRLGTKNLYVIGTLGTGISMLAASFVLPPKIVPLIVFFATTFLVFHVMGPNGVQSYVMINTAYGPSERGTAGGWNYFFSKLAAVVSSFWAPILFSSIGVVNTLHFLATFAFITAVIGAVLGFDARKYRTEEEAIPT